MKRIVKHWVSSIAPTIIFVILFVYFDSSLGLLNLWVITLFVIVTLASYYVPYQLIEGDERSMFYALVCCCIVLYCFYKIDQKHKLALQPYSQEICGIVANRVVDDLPKTHLWKNKRHLYQFDVLAGERGIQHFRKKSFAPQDGENVCVTYIDSQHSWLYAEHLILKIHSTTS